MISLGSSAATSQVQRAPPVLFTCSGSSPLAHGTGLKAVFYAGGTVKEFAEPLHDRNLTLVSAWAANAVPVAEFTLAQILLALKLGWPHVRQLAAHPGPEGWKWMEVRGVYGASVGIISLGMIGAKVIELLRPFSVNVQAFDPLVGEETMAQMGVKKMELTELFANSDVISVHAPLLKETEGMITGQLIATMKSNATFINTARGGLVRETEMIDVLHARPDLTAILDVTAVEPLPSDSPLYQMKNVILTPHIAGAMGDEVLRLSDLMIEEFHTWRSGRSPRYAIKREALSRIA